MTKFPILPLKVYRFFAFTATLFSSSSHSQWFRVICTSHVSLMTHSAEPLSLDPIVRSVIYLEFDTLLVPSHCFSGHECGWGARLILRGVHRVALREERIDGGDARCWQTQLNIVPLLNVKTSKCENMNGHTYPASTCPVTAHSLVNT